jgi:hypothetical protein
MARIGNFTGAKWDKTEIEFTMTIEFAKSVLDRPMRHRKVVIDAAKALLAEQNQARANPQ